MEMRQLGHSGLLVSELSLGTMIFGEAGKRGTNNSVAKRMIEEGKIRMDRAAELLKEFKK